MLPASTEVSTLSPPRARRSHIASRSRKARGESRRPFQAGLLAPNRPILVKKLPPHIPLGGATPGTVVRVEDLIPWKNSCRCRVAGQGWMAIPSREPITLM